MKTVKQLICLSLTLCGIISLNAQTLTHRFTFTGKPDIFSDSVKLDPGARVFLSGGNDFSVPPLVTGDNRPPGGSLAAMQLGMYQPEKKSGIRIESSGMEGSSGPLAEVGAMCAWFKPTGGPQLGHGAFLIRSLQAGLSVILYTENNEIFMQVEAGGTLAFRDGPRSPSLIPRPRIIKNQWHHIVIAWDTWNPKSADHSDTGGGAGRFWVYLNGYPLTPEGVATSSFEKNAVLRVGTTHPTENDVNGITKQFQGYVYDLQLYRGNVSATQVSELYEEADFTINEHAHPTP